MRCILKATIPTEGGNAAIRAGKLPQGLQPIMEELKPEAVYAYVEGGKRTVLLVVDVKESSQIPAVVEPLFLAAGADMQLIPAMSAEDLMEAAPSIEAAVKKYG